MSYTIPTSVQTKAEAVLAVASAIADEDMGARYDGTVNTSLDVLADVLAAQDVQVPQTNAGAILALAQYAHGGGGGSTATITVLELVGDEPTSQPSFKVETIGGEQIAVTPTTAVVGGEETPVYTFSATAGDVIVISVTDENLTFNADSMGGSWYSSAFDRPSTLYPSMIDKQEGRMTLIAASGGSCVLASLTSRSN